MGGDALRNARTCYDHLAGRLGVAMADALVTRDHMSLSEDGGVVTPGGEVPRRLWHCVSRARPVAPPVLPAVPRWRASDARIWQGAWRASLAARCFELDWITRLRDTRAVLITTTAKRGFCEDVRIDGGGPG
jgi:hypothetical protein